MGLQVTPGLISRSGTVPVTKCHDTPGLMGFTPSDLATLLDVIRARDAADILTHSIPPETRETNLVINNGRPLGSFSFGIAWDFTPPSGIDPTFPGSGTDLEVLLPATEEAFAKLKETGAVVQDVYMDLSASEMKSVPALLSDKVASDFRADFPPILRELKATVSCLEELIRFNEDHQAESMPPGEYGQDHLIRAAKAPVRTSDEYKSTAATLNELTRRRGLDHLFSTHDIDVRVLSLEVGYPAL